MSIFNFESLNWIWRSNHFQYWKIIYFPQASCWLNGICFQPDAPFSSAVFKVSLMFRRFTAVYFSMSLGSGKSFHLILFNYTRTFWVLNFRIPLSNFQCSIASDSSFSVSLSGTIVVCWVLFISPSFPVTSGILLILRHFSSLIPVLSSFHWASYQIWWTIFFTKINFFRSTCFMS